MAPKLSQRFCVFVIIIVLVVVRFGKGQNDEVEFASKLQNADEPTVIVLEGTNSGLNTGLVSESNIEGAASTSSTTTTTSAPITTAIPSSTTRVGIRTTRKPFTISSTWRRTVSSKKPGFLDRPKATTPLPALDDEDSHDDDRLSPEAKWKKFEDNTRNMVETLIKQMMPQLLKMSSSGANFTAQCTADFMKVIFGMRQLKGWALRLLDSSGRPQAGIFEGAITDFGDYDECLNVVATEKSTWGPSAGQTKELFHGKYCTLLMQPALPAKPKTLQKGTAVVQLGEEDSLLGILTESAHFFYHLRLRLGVCVPDSCVPHDAQLFMKEIWKHLGMKVLVEHCETKRGYSLEPHQIVCLSVLGLVVLAVLMGTTVDVVKTYYLTNPNGSPSTNGKVMQVAIAFSLYSNGKKLLNTSGGDKNMGALHGLRFISMTWVLLGHTYSYFHLSGFRGIKNLRDAPEDISFMAVLNGWVDVDTFFLLGGMALCYSILKKSNGKRYLNVGFYLFHRYWRLAPTFALVLAFSFLTPLLSSGPLWHDVVEAELNRCHLSWWRSLLFISNWYPLGELCMQPTWYLSCDFQLYLIALVILVPLLRWPSIGLFVNFFMMFASGIILAIITMYRGYPPSMTHVGPDAKFIERMAFEIHWKPYTHLGPYCVGIALGYLVYKQKEFKIKPYMVVLGWLSATTSAMAVLYGAYDWNNGHMPNELVTVTYASCHRTAWALSVAWVIFACIYGVGGIVNSFLSWKLFVPLSRLTFLMYLTHPVVMMVRIGSIRETHHFGHYALSYFFVSHTVFTIGAAFLGSLFLEWPFAGLENVFLGKGTKVTVRGGTGRNQRSDGRTKDCVLEKPHGVINIKVNGVTRPTSALPYVKNGGHIKRFTVPSPPEEGGVYVIGPALTNNQTDAIVSRL